MTPLRKLLVSLGLAVVIVVVYIVYKILRKVRRDKSTHVDTEVDYKPMAVVPNDRGKTEGVNSDNAGQERGVMI